MKLFGKIAVIIIIAAGVPKCLTALQIGFLQNSEVFAVGANHTYNPQSSSVATKLSFNSMSIIKLEGKTCLKISNGVFKAKKIVGKGLLILDGDQILINLKYADNIRIKAKTTKLAANLIVKNNLEIENGSFLILNNFNLSVSKSTFSQVLAAIVKNGQGRIMIIDAAGYYAHNSLPANSITKQLPGSKVVNILKTNHLYNISDNNQNFKNGSFDLCISQLYPPPTPPPEV